MAVKIKLQRIGKIRAPYYRIIVADARTRRDGKAIETIGKYQPKEEPSYIEVDSERAQYWLGVGAQPTEPVQSILEVTGDWQKHRGLPGAEGTLRRPEPKKSKQELFNEALAAANEEPSVAAVTPKKKGGGKKSEEQAGQDQSAESAESSGSSGSSGTSASAGQSEPSAEPAAAEKKADEA